MHLTYTYCTSDLRASRILDLLAPGLEICELCEIEEVFGKRRTSILENRRETPRYRVERMYRAVQLETAVYAVDQVLLFLALFRPFGRIDSPENKLSRQDATNCGK